MNQFTNAIGIDVSKKTLDAYDHTNCTALQVTNDRGGFAQLVKWSKKSNCDISAVIFCFEHTGMYSLPLAVYLSGQKLNYAIVSGLEVKKSQGIQRGKSDKKDSIVLAQYAYQRRESIKVYCLPSTNILALKSLLSLREKMVTERAGYKASQKEMRTFYKKFNSTHSVFSIQQKLISELSSQIVKVEKEIAAIINKDAELKRVFSLVTSVKGVGLILGTTLMVYTNCFTAFDNARKFASYCGIAPFDYQSGTSIKGRKKVSHFANKRIKALLSNAACTSIQFNPEMKLYYEKRINEGKNKMSVQNVIRNKIMMRVFAVVQRGTPYVDTFKFAA